MAIKFVIIVINYCFKAIMIIFNVKFTYNFVVMYFMKIVWIGKNLFSWVYTLDVLIKKQISIGMSSANKEINKIHLFLSEFQNPDVKDNNKLENTYIRKI